MHPRYHDSVKVINQAISSFNQHLHVKAQIPAFDLETMIVQKHCVQVIHGNWNAFGFPNSPKRGVYFIFGHEQSKPEKNGIYIGKASFNSAIGARLYAHLHPSRSQPYFTMNGYNNEVYIVDYMASIDLDACSLAFMAPALEEFLISNLNSSLHLINGTGN
jgi:hypothetical protein